MAGRDRFCIGLVQMDSGKDREANMEEAGRLAREAAARGADLAMFPETVDYIGPDFPGNASAESGDAARMFQGLAKELGIYLLGGSITEKLPGESRPANTSFLWNPQGERIARYRKLHMFDVDIAGGPACRESDEIQPGGGIVVARTALADFGLSICYDLRFGEMFRLMARAGAQVMLLAANFTRETGRAHWESLLRARAIENTCYVAACGQVGQKEKFRAHGNSMVVDPWGRVIAQAGDDGTEVITADVDLSYLRQVRRQLPSLENMREDIYTLGSSHLEIYEEPIG